MVGTIRIRLQYKSDYRSPMLTLIMNPIFPDFKWSDVRSPLKAILMFVAKIRNLD